MVRRCPHSWAYRRCLSGAPFTGVEADVLREGGGTLSVDMRESGQPYYYCSGSVKGDVEGWRTGVTVGWPAEQGGFR